MAYRKFYRRSSKPTPRNIEAKFASDCICCGGRINRGEYITYYPAGTIAGINEGKAGHIGGLNGTSVKCFNILKNKPAESWANDYAGDGLDERIEDGYRDTCGL
jgi:hypothetical protein